MLTGDVMSFEAAGKAKRRKSNAHVIVCGNEKGGSGKTTTSMHITVALLKAGFRVATIDLDTRQKSLTRYVQNRRNFAQTHKVDLELPSHFRFDTATVDSQRDAQSEDFAAFVRAVSDVEESHDFVVVDTPGSDNYLMRLSHSMADTLVTPMNDSFVDFDVLGRVDGDSLEIVDVSHYAMMVREARRQRRLADNGLLDWIVVRNRLASIGSRNQLNLHACVKELSLRLGFRVADGISERVVYREYFPKGLTALDDVKNLGLTDRASRSHHSALLEIRNLIKMLRLPVDEAGRQRADARKVWLQRSAEPVAMPDIFA
ncbi:division plane positioning ATPase MipZ [Ahrensia sp. R2A130]|uniref:division plane positioning ATPase MipZ n=1 Tax=Ahrensia sp. R2A130 TaxID=744979 RepID=UPI0001E0BC11|nr:division plane positioning ATPase MipZ [Ahrensia sp. R2A130]EFL90164.1 ATPase MipZ [Ahrensia sp. R2A130]